MKIKGVFLAAILTAVLCISGNLLAYSGGTGEPNNPYRIRTVADWQTLMGTSADWNKRFLLIADVNLAGVILTPVGNSSKNFTGVFDGNDNIISNAVINQPGSLYIGLFGYVGSGGQIRNLGIEDVNLTGYFLVGGLAGYTNSGTLTGCYATGSVNGDSYVGGMLGYNEGGTITSCYAAGLVSGKSGSVGGLVGYNYRGTLTSCYATDSVSGTGNYVGGLAGINHQGTLSSCSATGSVTGNSTVGGLAGRNDSGTLISCSATGLVTGSTQFVGGLAGENYHGSITTCYVTGSVTGTQYVAGLVGKNDATLTFCYATGSVNGNSTVAGLVGWNDSGTLTGCYAIGPVTGNSDTGGLVAYNYGGSVNSSYFLITSGPDNGYGMPLTDAQMKQQGSFVGWDFVGETANGYEDFWRLCSEGLEYPKLAWQYLQGDIICPDGVEIYDFAALGNQWLVEEIPADLAPPAGDGTVNFADFAVFAGQWGVSKDIYALNDFAQQWLKVGLRRCSPDISPLPDGDGVVNMLDFAMFAKNWLAGI